MAPSIPIRHHGQRFNLHIELAKKILQHPNNRAGNHDHLGINKHASRIQSYGKLPSPSPAITFGGDDTGGSSTGGTED